MENKEEQQKNTNSTEVPVISEMIELTPEEMKRMNEKFKNNKMTLEDLMNL